MTDWLARWEAGQIGFHSPEVNSRLIRLLPHVSISAGRVLVPLCGKSVDMLYFAQEGYEVVGVELSTLAVELFFSEHGLNYTQYGNKYQCTEQPITLFACSIFELTSEDIGEIDLVYDRAALVALDVLERTKYAEHITHITNGADIVLLSLSYDQTLMNGPPFSVDTSEVERVYGERYLITELECYDDIESETKFREHGLVHIYKNSYLLTGK